MRKSLFIFFVPFFLTACQSDGGRSALIAEIQTLQEEIGQEGQPDPGQISHYKKALLKYAANFPEDSITITYLTKAGEVARLERQFEEAIRIYDNIIVRYPDNAGTAKALFMKGFTYENDLGNPDSAGAAYMLFLEKYPDDGMAEDARFLLKNLGKKPEEVLKELEGR